MFSNYLTDFNLILIGLVAAYVAGVLTAQKVKDVISGIPSRARAALKASENDVRAKLKAAEEEVLSKLPGAVPVKAPAPAGTPLKPLPAAPQPVYPSADVQLRAPIVTVEKTASPAPAEPLALTPTT
jgi:hypothetical protein